MDHSEGDDRRTVLVMADHYLPGFKAGGPIRTLQNLIDALGDEFRFLVITRDRDLSDTEAYTGVRLNAWNNVGPAKVYYASPDTLTWPGLRHLLGRTRFDVLYLNSFFSPLMTVLPLVLRRVYGRRTTPVVLAPRGEFSPGALALKPAKKRAYFALAHATGLLSGLRWQATSDAERAQIIALVRARPDDVAVAPNLPSVGRVVTQIGAVLQPVRASGPLRMVFLSRISPMKNLDFLISVLRQVRTPATLTVHGPVVDAPYWKACQDAAHGLPRHIRVTYAGEVQPARVAATFAEHDVFVFPTRGENFGHVILESLTAGTPVIISDRTPWQADANGAVTVLTLDGPEGWARTIETWAGLDDTALEDRRVKAAALANAYLSKNGSGEAHRQLFLAALAPLAAQCDRSKQRDPS